MSDQNELGRSELPKYSVVTTFDKPQTKYVLLIPVLNEGQRIQSQLKKIKSANLGVDVFIVDGGSVDNSLNAGNVKDLGVRKFIVKDGPGRQGAQIRIGIYEALADGYEGIILMDGNDKDEVFGISNMILALDKGFDLIQGSRFLTGGRSVNLPKHRELAIKFIHAPILNLFSGYKYSDTTNGFKAISKKYLLDPRLGILRKCFMGYELHYQLNYMAKKLGMNITEIPVGRIYPTGQIPTKIKGLWPHIKIVYTLLTVCFGRYRVRGMKS